MKQERRRKTEEWKTVMLRMTVKNHEKLKEISNTSGLSMGRIVTHALHELLKAGTITISETWTWTWKEKE